MKTLFAILLSLAAALNLTAAEAQNAVCPKSGKPVDASVTSEYVKVVGFCCNNCKGKFDKDPSAFIEKIASFPVTAVNKACPVGGRPAKADKTVKVGTVTYAVCCDRCLAKAEADPTAFVKDLEYNVASNTTCPVSGKDVNPEVVSVFKTTVSFCCNNCKKDFDSNPDALITKVK